MNASPAPHWTDLLNVPGAAWSWILGPGLALGATSTICTATKHPELYVSWGDFLVHATAAFLSYAAIAAFFLSGIFALRLSYRLVEPRSRWWRALWLALTSLAVSLFLRRHVLARIDVLGVIGRWVYCLAVPASAAMTLLVPRWMDRPLPWRPWYAGILLISAAILGQVALQRTIWADQLPPPLLVVTMVVCAGVGAALLARSGRIWMWGRPVAPGLATLLLALSIGVLVLRPPSSRLRKAILVYGGVERVVIRGLLWPFVADRFLAADSLWRSDPPSARTRLAVEFWRQVTIDGHIFRVDEGDSGPATVASLSRSMVWVLVDTLRADSVASALAASPVLRDAFSTFTWYPKYRSCSSSTRTVLAQMLGPRNGRSGLLQDLDAAGYQTARFGLFPDYSPPGYSLSVSDESDPVAVARARAWLVGKRMSQKPIFVFLHLKGGHEPVRTTGSTSRQRYELAVSSVLRLLPEFLSSVPADWITMVSSDHGEAFGEHGLRGHSNALYDELLKAPLLVRGLGSPPGADDEVVGCPEILRKIRRALAGMPYAVDRAPYQLASFSNRGRDGFVIERQAALTIGRFKSIWNIGANTWELYDLSLDQGERTDLSDLEPTVVNSFVRAFHLADAAHQID